MACCPCRKEYHRKTCTNFSFLQWRNEKGTHTNTEYQRTTRVDGENVLLSSTYIYICVRRGVYVWTYVYVDTYRYKYIYIYLRTNVTDVSVYDTVLQPLAFSFLHVRYIDIYNCKDTSQYWHPCIYLPTCLSSHINCHPYYR